MLKSKSVLVLSGIFPPDIGGPATQLDHLIKELIKNNFKVEVLTFGSPEVKKFSYPVKSVSRKIAQPWRAGIYLVKAFLASLKADILYAQDLYFPGWCGWILKKILGKKLVTRFVGDSAWETALNRAYTHDEKNLRYHKRRQYKYNRLA